MSATIIATREPAKAAPASAAIPHLRALTGLRFFAAFWVVAVHATENGLVGWPAGLRQFISSGWLAVSLFFVLSGFILAVNYGHRPKMDRASFWVARFARVWPVYILALILSLPSFIAHLRQEFGGLGPAAPHIAWSGSAVLLLLQSWTPRSACLWNCPAWSLSDEAFFYLVFPWVVVWFATRPRKTAAIAAFLSLAGAWAAVLAWQLVTAGASNPVRFMANYVPIVRLPEFLLGVAVGFWYLRTRNGGLARWLAEPAVLVVILSLFLPWPAFLASHRSQVLAPVFALLVLALAYGDGPLSKFLGTSLITRLGEASYALYLLHVPVHSWMWAADRAMGGRFGDTTWFTALYFAVSIALSVPVFLWFEEPARHRIRSWFAARRPKPVPAPAVLQTE